jgi:hypothetical protein
METMSHALFSVLLAAALFVGIVLSLLAGRRIGIYRRSRDPVGATTGISAVEGSIFGLVGLLIAFTFSGAAARFDHRRDLIVQEANAIGTAFLRLDLLPDAPRDEMRGRLRDYLDARLEAYRTLQGVDTTPETLARSTAMQAEIWSNAVRFCREPGMQQATMLILPALNEVIDITATRSMATLVHPPRIIYALLFVLTLVSALLAGYHMSSGQHPSRLHLIGFATTMALAIYVILDLEYPRAGFIRVDSADQVLIELRKSMD